MPSLYDISVPLFIRSLKNLSGLLKKGEEHATSKGIDVQTLIDARLASDMKPLTFQIQSASNTAKNTCVRVAGMEAVPMEDNETTFLQLQERIAATIKLLEGIDAKAFEGKEAVDIEFIGRKFTGESYITTFAIPNFYFHVVTAYAILRNQGVEIGKRDYITGGQ